MGLKLPDNIQLKRFFISWSCLVGLMLAITIVIFIGETSITQARSKARADEMMYNPQVQQALARGMTRDQVMKQLDQQYAWPEACLMVRNMKSAAVRATIIAVLLTIVLYLALTARRLNKSEMGIVAAAALILLLADLGYVASCFVKDDTMPTSTGDTEKLATVARPFRVSVLTKEGTYNLMLSGLFGKYGIECVDVPADSRPSPDRAAFFYSDALGYLRRWQYGNVRFVLGPKEMLEGALQQLRVRDQFVPFSEHRDKMDGQTHAIYEFTNALPRVFAVGSWVVRTTADDVLSFMADPTTEPHRVAVISEALRAPRSISNFTGAAVVSNYTTERIEASVNLSHDGMVVMATEPNSGWRVTVDGKPGTLMRCNLLHQGVMVPAGTHTVVFSYYIWHWSNTVNEWAYYALPVLVIVTAAVLLIPRLSRRGATAERTA